MGDLAIFINEQVQVSLGAVEVQVKRCAAALIQLIQQVQQVALEVMPLVAKWAREALVLGGTLLLFLSNSSIFVIGMCFGMINTETMDRMLTDIQNVASRIMREKDFTKLATIVVGAVLAWPITMAASAFFVGGYHGSRLKKPDGEPDHVT